MKSEPLTAWDDPGDVDGCAYIVTNGHDAPCGEPCLPGSSYCLTHHQRCHLRRGSTREALKLTEFERDALREFHVKRETILRHR
jgi:hypothetical protein